MTALTQESEALLAELRTMADSPDSWRGVSVELLRARLGRDLPLIEAAAARRALEGSGVVAALAMVTDALDVWVEGSHRVAGGRCPHRDDGPCTSHRVVAEARRILAALPRPEEPRVERCAFVWKSGTPCGKPKRDSRHKHDSSCLTGGEGHITDMLCHPFTPGGPLMDDVTALRDALLAKLTSDWDFDPYGEHEAAVMRLRADLDTLIAAVEARAALTPERLAKALVATTIFAGHAHDCPVWMNRMIELRGERVDLDTCTCWVKDEAPDRARRILAALPRPEEPRVERCAGCGNERDAAIEVHADPGAAWPFHPYTPEAR